MVSEDSVEMIVGDFDSVVSPRRLRDAGFV